MLHPVFFFSMQKLLQKSSFGEEEAAHHGRNAFLTNYFVYWKDVGLKEREIALGEIITRRMERNGSL